VNRSNDCVYFFILSLVFMVLSVCVFFGYFGCLDFAAIIQQVRKSQNCKPLQHIRRVALAGVHQVKSIH
jgi:hypothetical protein